MYRKLIRSYVAFRQFPCYVPKEYSGFPENKLQTGTNFYHYMVSIYAALFRATTPLYTDFRAPKNRQLLCDEEDLIEAFLDLRTESFYFRKCPCLCQVYAGVLTLKRARISENGVD